MLCHDYTQLAEPNLLIPGKKPAGLVIPRSDVLFMDWPELSIGINASSSRIVGTGIQEDRHDNPHYGLAWDAEQEDATAYVRFSYPPVQVTEFTVLAHVHKEFTTTSNHGIFGNWDSQKNAILVRSGVSGVHQGYILTDQNISSGPSQVTLASSVDRDVLVVFRWDGTYIRLFVDGVAGNNVSATGSMNLGNQSLPFGTGHVGASQKSHRGRIAAVVMLNTALSDIEIAEISRTFDLHRFVEAA